MTDTRGETVTPAGRLHQLRGDLISSTRYWWLMVIAGAAWLVVAIVILRFNYATVTTIATLFAFFCFVAAVNELMVGVASSPGWRILHWLLAVAFIVVGVFAFIRPDPTFVGLAAVMSFYFIFRGGFDIAMAIAGSGSPGWWVLLLVGLAQVAIGFWAAGSWKVSVVLLVSWVAAGALMYGIGQISTGFMVRRVGKALEETRPAATPD